MTEHKSFTYEWTFLEEQKHYYCAGQVCDMAVVQVSDNEFIGALYDPNPVDDLWDTTNEGSLIDHMMFDTVHDAMDWCEERDMSEAEYDSMTFDSGVD